MTEQREDLDPVAVALALSGIVVDTATTVTRRATSALHPVSRVLLEPSWLPRRLRPQTVIESLARQGQQRRSALALELARRLDIIVPVLLAEVLRRATVTELVLRYVDLDRVVAGVDLDAAASRLDVAAIVEQVEVDPVVARVDLDAVIQRIDMESVLDRIDMENVIERIDMDVVLDRIDLTRIVLERVDLDAVVTAILAHIDLVGLAGEVIEGVDLPEIIRESTGSMASDTVQGARMQGIVADEAVSRAVDRLLLRRRHRATQAPGGPGRPGQGE
ncbi:MAG: hypothetical protein WCA30_01075 [Dermatophilaceae bacterium]